ncbi:HAD family hydrolase [Variovorax sp. LT1P1]|uniref:HAD family hydrolase n=1 Tax=Variovorax sp. LT1P1 TaxID=3443730 RepID=UPI003F4942B4
MNNYSFDIFDTLISRKFANDKGVFVALREKLEIAAWMQFPDYFIDEFVAIRLRAQKLAHERSLHPEITLNEIYAAMGLDFPQLEPEHLQLLQEWEESIEIESCYSITQNVSRVMELVDSGRKVFLISDMYLSKRVVLRMLENADSRLCSIPLYLSSELKVRKADGTLFRHVCDDQKIQPGSLVHTGDNFSTDCVMAKRTGVKYVFYQDSSLSKVERSYFQAEQNLFLQLFVGASKRTRLEGYGLKPSYRLGASFMGPMFYGFVHDLLKQAINEGIKRLYFLARDGYLLKIIAEEIIACFRYNIEICYLYTSRQATYFASIFCITTSNFPWIFQEMDNEISFNVVASRLHFEPNILLGHLDQDLRQALDSHGFGNRLTRYLIDRLQNEFLSNLILKAKIESEARTCRETVIGYFEQEGLFRDERIGFVDIGWRGTLQDAIFKILKSKKPDFKLTSYYLAVTHFSAHTSRENRKVPAYMFPSTKPGIGPMLELLLQCEHGTTVSYRRDEAGRFEPVLKAPSVHLEDWGLDNYKEGIRTFSRTLSQSLAAYPRIETTYAAITPILTELLKDATPEVTATLGELHYSGNIEESGVRRFAPPFTASQALRYMVSSERYRSSYTQWVDASYSRSGLLPRILIKLDPRHNFLNIVRKYTSREELMEKKQFVKRLLDLHLGFIRK